MADPFRQDFGASLREARERTGITLREISVRTKISRLTLEALERNDLSRLPGGVFTRAFVRSYAREIGLDPEEALTRFLRQFPEAGGDAELREPGSEGLEREPRTGGARALRVLAWLLPILAGIAYFGFLRSGGAIPTVTRSESAEARPSLPAPPTPAQAGSTEGAVPEGPSEDSPPAVQPAAVPPATVTPTGGAEGLPAPQAPPVPEGALRLTLAPAGACWISLKADGQPVFSGLMQAGERREFDLRGEVALTAGDAGALVLTINGERARPLGDPGKVVTIRFSPETFRALLAPR